MRTPIAMPAIAPLLMLVEDPCEGAAAVDVGETLVLLPLLLLLLFVEVVVLEVVLVVDEDVCVAAMRVIGVKMNELAEGEAELSEEKVSLSWVAEMLVRVSCAVFQQMLIWFDVWVHDSLF